MLAVDSQCFGLPTAGLWPQCGPDFAEVPSSLAEEGDAGLRQVVGEEQVVDELEALAEVQLRDIALDVGKIQGLEVPRIDGHRL